MPNKRLPAVHVIAVLSAFAAVSIASPRAWAQQPVCSPNSTSRPVHAEGQAELVGDLTISCTGGTPGNTVSLALFISLNTNITNRLDADQNPVGITVTGATVASLRMTSASTISFSPLNYTVPALSSTPVVITVGGIRAAVAPLGTSAPITATILGIGATFPPGFSVVVAGATPSLLSSVINNGVPCSGSPLPATLDFLSLSSVSIASTVRITEASASAFTLAEAGADSGLRIRVNLTGYGSGARVFVPDAIVGNDGSLPTQNGAYGTSVSPGTYTPGSRQLLLIRVSGASAGGAGGALVMSKPISAVTFGGVSEITLSGGAASVVYEVVDGNPLLIESAQIPVFVAVAATSCPGTLNPQLAVNIGPVSAVSTASATEAIPRFQLTAPATDCQPNGDCSASYYPKLFVDQTAVTLAASSKGTQQSTPLRVTNAGAGILSYTSSITYQSGAGWLSLSPPSGSTSTSAVTSLQIIADPALLAPGTWTATLTINASPYGTAVIPVTFNVGPVGVVVQNVGNAASFQYGTVAPGSYAVVYGLNMGGTNVSVTFNSLPATLIYKSASQINLIVPTTLGSSQAASVVVIVDGVASNAFKVNLVPNAPGIFTPGIVNFTDGSVNDAGHPAARGDFVIIFFTGLTVPLTGQVTVNIGSQTNLIPAFAGAQPTLPALDQVNITVPSVLAVGISPVPLQVCIPGTTGQQVCSNQVNLYVK